MPKISVILSVYNGEKYLETTIRNTLNQKYKNFEFIIINDGSTDSTPKILQKWKKKDQRIKIIQNKKNCGLTKSLNKGIKAAKGRYIARIDCGDLSDSKRFEKQITFFEKHPDLILLGSWYEAIDLKGNVLKKIKLPTTHNDIQKVIVKFNPFAHSSLMFRRNVLLKEGLYNEKYKYAQDYELALRIVKKYKVANLPGFLMKYQLVPQSISFLIGGRSQKAYAIKARWQAIVRYGYPKWQIVYLLKPCLIYLIPPKILYLYIKNFVWRKK